MARTILQIAQDAAPRLGLASPDALFGSTDRTSIELRAVVNEVAERIADAHDWEVLTEEETNTGDGTTEGFDLPSNYVRMPKDAQVWSTRWQRPMLQISSDDWLRLDIRQYDLVIGTYIIRGGQIRFRPVLASGELAKWNYVSNLQVSPSTGNNKERFTDDTDTFRLDDRVLETTLIWEWRHRKGLPYAEDMKTAEIALARAISDDKGARIVTQSSRRNVRAKIAYPWQIQP
ncbi:MAG: hypothetical protein AAF562_06660 [Pseudomonadota bacterium]